MGSMYDIPIHVSMSFRDVGRFKILMQLRVRRPLHYYLWMVLDVDTRSRTIKQSVIHRSRTSLHFGVNLTRYIRCVVIIE